MKKLKTKLLMVEIETSLPSTAFTKTLLQAAFDYLEMHDRLPAGSRIIVRQTPDVNVAQPAKK